MISLICAVAIYTNCLQCSSGWIEIDCRICKGKGYTVQRALKVPCRRCPDGLYNSRVISSGKVRSKCKSCKGKGKLKANDPKIVIPSRQRERKPALEKNPLVNHEKK